MKQWKQIIDWFELAKQATGIKIPDNFKQVKGQILIEGEYLNEWIDSFYSSEGIDPEQDIYSRFDLSDMDNRMNLKSFLIKFLSDIQAVIEQESCSDH